MLQRVIADEDDGIEAFEDHANLRRRVPAVMTSGWGEWGFEAMTTTSTHSIEKSGAAVAEEGVLLNIIARQYRGDVKMAGCNATVLMAFEMGKIARCSVNE